MANSDRTYSISELAREFDCTARALRFYEDKGLLSPRREGLTRIYSERDRARLILILRGKVVGLSLIDIKEILDLYKGGDVAGQDALALKKFKERVVALEAQRSEIDHALELLRKAIARIEAKGVSAGGGKTAKKKNLEGAA